MDNTSADLLSEDAAYLWQLLSGQAPGHVDPSMKQRMLDAGLLVHTFGVLRPTPLAIDLFNRSRQGGRSGQVVSAQVQA
jgi:hypothetical protein